MKSQLYKEILNLHLTSYAASLMNCFATGVHIAGTVNTHWMSFTLKWPSPVRWQITFNASSFRYLIE